MSLFKEKKLQAELKKNGFTVLDKLDSIEINGLKGVYKKFEDKINFKNGIAITVLLQNAKLKREIHESILSETKTFFHENFKNFNIPLAHFFVKMPFSGEVDIHQDPMICFQDEYPSYGLWIPLQETNIENGCVWVLPKSHKMFSNLQTDFPPFEYNKGLQEINENMTPVPLQKGEVLIMDNRLIHKSTKNRTDNYRLAVVIKLTHKKAKLHVCLPYKNKRLIIQQERDFYLKTNWLTQKKLLPFGKLQFVIDSPTIPLEKKDVLDRLNNPDQNRPSIINVRKASFTEKALYAISTSRLFRNFSI